MGYRKSHVTSNLRQTFDFIRLISWEGLTSRNAGSEYDIIDCMQDVEATRCAKKHRHLIMPHESIPTYLPRSNLTS